MEDQSHVNLMICKKWLDACRFGGIQCILTSTVAYGSFPHVCNMTHEFRAPRELEYQSSAYIDTFSHTLREVLAT